MTASTRAPINREELFAHVILSLIAAAPVIGGIFLIGATLLSAVLVLLRSTKILSDLLFVAAYPVAYLLWLGTIAWIARLFVGEDTALIAGQALTIPVSIWFLHHISRRVG